MDLIIKFLELIHLLIAIFVIFGGYFINDKFLPIYLLVGPFIAVDWNDTDKNCFVTQITNMIKYKSFNPESQQSDEFILKSLKSLNININYSIFNFLLYLLVFLSWLFAFYRLINKYNIRLFPNKQSKYTIISIVCLWGLTTLPSLIKELKS